MNRRHEQHLRWCVLTNVNGTPKLLLFCPKMALLVARETGNMFTEVEVSTTFRSELVG